MDQLPTSQEPDSLDPTKKVFDRLGTRLRSLSTSAQILFLYVPLGLVFAGLAAYGIHGLLAHAHETSALCNRQTPWISACDTSTRIDFHFVGIGCFVLDLIILRVVIYLMCTKNEK